MLSVPRGDWSNIHHVRKYILFQLVGVLMRVPYSLYSKYRLCAVYMHLNTYAFLKLFKSCTLIPVNNKYNGVKNGVKKFFDVS